MKRSNRVRDIEGQRFGRLTAVRRDGQDATGKTMWLCSCDCGKEARATLLNLTSGNTKSCGCLKHRRSRLREDLAGRQFGRLIAIAPVDSLRWRCKCICGNESIVRTVHLTHDHTRSCGCLARARVDTPGLAARRARNSAATWAKDVVAEAVWRCDACAGVDRLHAHHILPFAQFRAFATHPENGASLCGPCHRAVHRRIAGGALLGTALADHIASCVSARVESGEFIPTAALIKYLARAPLKGGAEDYQKAAHYLEKLLSVLNKGDQPC